MPSHIGIPGKDNADHAAKLATTHTTLNAKLRPTASDLLFIRHFISESWYTFWQDQKPYNKLSLLKCHPLARSSSNLPSRRHEIIVSRLRIGHFRLTHTDLISLLHLLNCPHCSLVDIRLSTEFIFTNQELISLRNPFSLYSPLPHHRISQQPLHHTQPFTDLSKKSGFWFCPGVNGGGGE